MYGKEKAKHEEHYETGCLVLALALLPVSAFAAEFNAPGEYPICKETVKLTVGIPDNIRIEDFETNVMTKSWKNMQFRP